MTKRLLATAMVLLALGGCGDDPEPPQPTTTPATAVTTKAQSPTTPATTARSAAGPDAFVAAVQRSLPEIAADRRDDEIAAVAQDACAGLAQGDDADAIVARTRSLGTADAEATDQATARELVKLAIDTVCPDQDRRVDEF
jgi:hypothetical protein